MSEIHMGDVGVAIEFDVVDDGVAVDVSTATVKRVRARKPDGTAAAFDVSFLNDGENGKLVYISKANDLDQDGVWRFQIYVEMPSGSFHSSIVNRRVYENLLDQATAILDAATLVASGQAITIP
jgi:hypothetical protein